MPLTDSDVLTFALAGCNASEVAAYFGIAEADAEERLDTALRLHYGFKSRDASALARMGA